MSNHISRHVVLSQFFFVTLIALSICGSAVSHAGDNDQDNYGSNNTTTYNSGSRSVTVTGNGSKSGSGGSSKGNSHTGQVLICGRWMSVAAAAAIQGCQAPESGPSVAQIATQVAASVTLPLNSPVFGPSPTQNQWGMIPVGYPLWLWTTSDQTTVTTSAEANGLTVSVTATRQSVTYVMGDGHQVSCTRFTVRPSHLADPMQKSPTCGYVYQTTGQFTITATTSWLIAWSAAGESGSFTVTDTASSPTLLPVGELSSVITDHP